MGLSEQIPFRTTKLLVDNAGRFIEKETGRRFRMHGLNFASNTKLPQKPLQPTNIRPEECGLFDEADTVSFIDKPFPLNEAYEHLSRIKQCGFNTIRFVTTWEAIEHKGPGIYDKEYVDYVVNLIKVIDEVGGLYVFIDPHQDVWSRFSGGSGAPFWSFYAAGLEPRNFDATLAAKIHHLADVPEKFTKMVWTTNYNRLASCTMFTLFFNGKIFTPKAKINNMNIQEYLQSHFIDSFAFLMSQIKANLPHVFDTCFLGIESMNEPNSGFFGFENLNQCPANQKLKLDETPTPIQALRLGMGQPEKLDTYSLSIFGPTKTGSKMVDPQGVKAWIEEAESKDEHYGFKRSPDWKLGDCIFAQHGVWDSSTGDLILPNYFEVHPKTGEKLDEAKFINGPFLDFWLKFKNKMRSIDDEMFLIMQPPVFEIPPKIKNDSMYVDKKTIVALHYYDGISLMFQKWNRVMNVDTLGIMRGRYLNPVFGIVLGESNIRNSIRTQLKEMTLESKRNVGLNVPIIITETGMPFNMENKVSYTSGDYTSQEAANDAILSALEKEQISFTYWCYNPDNCHIWGDLWNLEDFSIWSKDDIPNKEFLPGATYNEWLLKNILDTSYIPHESNDDDQCSVDSERSSSVNSVGKETFKVVSHSYIDSSRGSEIEELRNREVLKLDLTAGIRAVNAIIRPVPLLTNGIVKICDFEMSTKSFNLEVYSDPNPVKPDIILIPELHYSEGHYEINVSGGTFKVKRNSLLQWIEWDHSDCDAGILKLTVKVGGDYRQVASLKGTSCGYY